MNSITTNKTGDIIFFECDCGRHHKITLIPENEEKKISEHFDIETTFKKPDEPLKKEKVKSIFRRGE